MTHRSRACLYWSGVAFVAVGLAGGFISACEDPHRRSEAESPDAEPVTPTGCKVVAGATPPPNCDDSAGVCEGKTGCVIDEAQCGSKSTCLPIGNNVGRATQDFRIRRLNIAAPEALRGAIIRDAILIDSINLKSRACGDKTGSGTFSWLLRVDRTKNVLTTGGAPPSDDPLAKGYCFARGASDGISFAPMDIPIKFSGDTWDSVGKFALTVPIFVAGSSGGVILLPLTDVALQNVKITENGNCIGSFNAKALASDCSEYPDNCAKWRTSGSLTAFITLEDADKIMIPQTASSLCTVLTLTVKGPDGRCVRENGRIKPKGDYCSTEKKPGGCQDSVWLAATLAASAAKIVDGSDDFRCNGMAPDGGSDARKD